MKKLNAFLLIAGFVATFSACKKDEQFVSTIKDKNLKALTNPTSIQPISTIGVYMLCEGLMGNNNSAISYYNVTTGTVDKDYFKTVNGYKLGETANDLQRYGSKMYCVVSGIQGGKNSYLEVISVATGKSLKRIPFFNATTEYMPRYVAFNNGKAYISGYDGMISRVDTALLTIEARVQAGGALEGLAIANNKLYVANSDHPLHPNASKNSVSVVDLATFTKTSEIVVGYNPVKVAAAANGDLLVVSWGDYANIAPELKRINSTTDLVTGSYPYNVGPLAITGNTAYLIGDWNSWIKPFNVATGVLGSNFITDGTAISTAYGVTVDHFGDVYIADAMNYNSNTGKTFCFSANGTKKFEFATAGLPQHAVFVYSY